MTSFDRKSWDRPGRGHDPGKQNSYRCHGTWGVWEEGKDSGSINTSGGFREIGPGILGRRGARSRSFETKSNARNSRTAEKSLALARKTDEKKL